MRKEATHYLGSTAIHVVSMFASMRDVTINLVEVSMPDEFRSDYVHLLEKIDPVTVTCRSQKKILVALFHKSVEQLLPQMTDYRELFRMAQFYGRLHDLYHEIEEEPCNIEHTDEEFVTLMAAVLAEPVFKRKIQRMVEKMGEGEESDTVVLRVKPKNSSEFMKDMVNDIRSGLYFNQKLYSSEIEMDANGYLYWSETGESRSEDEWSDFITFDEEVG